MATRVSALRPTDQATPTIGSAFRTGPRPAKSASTQRRPTLRTSSDAGTQPRTTLRTSSDASTEPRTALRTSSDASTQPRTALRNSSDVSTEPRTGLRTSPDVSTELRTALWNSLAVSTQRRPPVRPIPFVSEERRPALRPFDFHVLSFLPGRIADETGFPPVRTRRRRAKAVSAPSEHRTSMRRCAAQAHFSAHCAAQAHLSRRRIRVPRRPDRVPDDAIECFPHVARRVTAANRVSVFHEHSVSTFGPLLAMRSPGCAAAAASPHPTNDSRSNVGAHLPNERDRVRSYFRRVNRRPRSTAPAEGEPASATGTPATGTAEKATTATTTASQAESVAPALSLAQAAAGS